MTDRQLAALLRLIAEELEDAIAEAKDELPDECIERGQNNFGFQYENVPILDRFVSIEASITAKCEMLES